MTRKQSNSRAALLAGLLLSLASHGAQATDEVVVYGDEVVRQARIAEQEFQDLMSDYTKAIDKDVKASLAKEIERIEPPRLQVALSDEPALG